MDCLFINSYENIESNIIRQRFRLKVESKIKQEKRVEPVSREFPVGPVFLLRSKQKKQTRSNRSHGRYTSRPRERDDIRPVKNPREGESLARGTRNGIISRTAGWFSRLPGESRGKVCSARFSQLSLHFNNALRRGKVHVPSWKLVSPTLPPYYPPLFDPL